MVENNYQKEIFDSNGRPDWNPNSFKYSKYTINWASIYGHISVLEWFRNSGYEFIYSKYAINWAYIYGHISVIEWFRNSGYEFKYSNRVFIIGHISVVEWFNKNGFKKKLIK